MEFAGALRRKASHAGHATLVSTFHRLLDAVEGAAGDGWHVSVGPFVGSWHDDPFNARLLVAHLGAQDLFLEDVQRRSDGSVVYVVSWSDEPDWDRLAAPKTHYTRPRRHEDPLFAEFMARKQYVAEKQKRLMETEDFREFVQAKREKKSALTRVQVERQELQISRQRWKRTIASLDREKGLVSRVRAVDTLLARKFAIPLAVTGVKKAEDAVPVLPRAYLTKAEFVKEKNTLLDVDFEQRAQQSAARLALCKAGDRTGPVAAPGIKGIPVDLSDGSRNLCRCGQSAFYPFCDMTHIKVNQKYGTTFAPWRADADVVGSDVIVVCGCGESKQVNSAGVLLCDQKTCEDLAVVRLLRNLETTAVASPESPKNRFDRSSRAFESAKVQRVSAMTSLDQTYRAARSRWLNALAMPLPSLTAANAEESVAAVKRENLEICNEEEKLRREMLTGLEASSVTAEELSSTREEVVQLAEERLLRLRANLMPVRHASLQQVDDSEKEFDRLFEDLKSFIRLTTERLEMRFLDVAAPGATLEEWKEECAVVHCELGGKMEALERKGNAAKQHGADVEGPLRAATTLRGALLETMTDIEEEVRGRASQVASVKEFDSEEEEKRAVSSEIQEQGELEDAQRQAAAAAELQQQEDQARSRRESEEAAVHRRIEEIQRLQREEHEAAAALARREEEQRLKTLELARAQEEEGKRRALEEEAAELRRVEEIQRQQREKHEAAAERIRVEEEQRKLREAAEAEAELTSRRATEAAEKQRQLQAWLAEEKERKALEEEAARKRGAALEQEKRLVEAEEIERKRVAALDAERNLQKAAEAQAKEQEAEAARVRERLELERRVAEAERKRGEKKLNAAKSPRTAVSDDLAAQQQRQGLERAALQREQAEKGAAAAQSGVWSLEKGEVGSAVQKTRAIDTATPDLGRKLKSPEESLSPQVLAPGQEEVVNAPAVLRANFSGKTWSQLAALQVPLSVRLLDVAKRRQDEPAFKYKVGSEWIAVSWSKYAGMVEKAAKSLVALGVKRGDKILLLAETRFEWSVTALASQMVGGIVVTAFNSVSADALTALVQEQLPAVLVTDDAGQWDKLRAKGSRVSPIKHIVALGSAVDDKRALSWDNFLARGEEVRASRIDGRISQISPSDTSTISYSERSLRSVVLSHASEMFATDSLTKMYSMEQADRILAFMPYANAAERVLSMYQPINSGSLVYYGDSLAMLHDNITAVQPTVIFSAPVLWEKFAAVILAKLGSKDPATLASSVQKKLRKFIGCSRLRVGLSAMASIRPETISFYRALGLPLRSVYAKSAVSGIATYNDGSNAESLGVPFDGMSFASDTNTGELIVKGPGVSICRYGGPFFNGTLHTGDMARLTADRCVHFVGRLDRQAIMSGGVKVNLDMVELALCANPLVAGAFAVSTGNSVGVLLALNREVAKEAASKVQMSIAEYLSSPAVGEKIDKHVEAVNASLPSASRVSSYRAIPKEFSVKEGEVTSHALVIPSVLSVKYASLIKEF